MTTFTEQTHSLVRIHSIFDSGAVKFPDEITDNVRLLRSSKNGDYNLLVLDEINDNPFYFEFVKKLRTKDIRPEVEWVTREEIANLSSIFDMSKDSHGDSNTQSQDTVIRIIKKAVDMRASDIHFRLEPSFFLVSFRIDGIKRKINDFQDSCENGKKILQTLYHSMCTEQSTTTLSYTEPSEARIKEQFVTEFGLSTGRFASRPGSTQDNLFAVVRLISKRRQQLELESLGLTPKQVSILRRVLNKPSGVIFSSGPTGHGKSTLSQCMAENVTSSDQGINLITVEDPVESPIRGAVQTPLIIADRSDRALIGAAWGKAISNLMRLDPDYIYIGEVRDSTSATGVIEAAQTGHNVITTIHTSHPIDIIQRLRRFGVDEDLLTDATLITCLVGLRLSPVLCPHCKKPFNAHADAVRKAEPEVIELIEKYVEADGVFLINEQGCEKCNYTGVNGRIGVFEVIETDYRFMSLYKNRGKFAAWQHWRKNGGETLCERITSLINAGMVDPVMSHKKICNLDRDDKFNE